MKKVVILALAIAAMVFSAAAENADTLITVTSNMNVQINLAPDGAVDGSPTWSINGLGSMTVINPWKYVFVTGGAGVSTITFTATAGGVGVTNRVVVTVLAPVPPATTLAPGVSAISK